MLKTDILLPQAYVMGDNWALEIRAKEYPPSQGYVLTVTVIPVTEGPTFTLVSNPAVPGKDDKHLIQFTGTAITALNIVPGDFRAQAVLTNPSDTTVRKTLGFFDLTIEPDYTLNYTTGFDPRSYNVKCLEALELVLSGQASQELLEYTFKDATFKYKPIEDLIKLRDYFQTEVEIEEGKKPGRYLIKPLYRPPSYFGI